MAHTVTGATLDGIQGRLSQVSGYHPHTAKTFADWSMQAGDMVTVSRGNENYTSPVHSSKLVWKGGVNSFVINSTGSKERPAVAAVSRKKYGRGGTAVRSEERIYHEFISEDQTLRGVISATAADLTIAYQNADQGLSTQIQTTAAGITAAFQAADAGLSSQITASAAELRTEYQNADAGLSTRITENATSITAEASARQSDYTELKGMLIVQADKTGLVISSTDNREIRPYARESAFPRPGSTSYIYLDLATGKYYEWDSANSRYVETTPGNHIDRAGIISTINDDGSSTTYVKGDKILLGTISQKTLDGFANDAKNKAGVFADYLAVRQLTAQEITTMLADIGEADIGDLYVDTVQAESLVVREGGNVSTPALLTDEINEWDIDDFLADADISNSNTLTFYKVGDGRVTISKSQDGKTLTFTDASGNHFSFEKTATPTLSGSWSSGTLTVSSDPAAVADYTRTLSEDIPNATWGAGYVSVPVLAQWSSGASTYTEQTGKNVYVPFSGRLENRTGANKITANGTYTASPNYIGFGEIEIDVSGTITADVKTRFNASSGQYYIEAFDNTTLDPIFGSSKTYKLGLNAAGTKVQIQDTSDARISNTPEYTIPSPTVGNISLGSFSAPYTYTASVTVNGTAHTNSVTAPEAYSQGWTGCYNGVGLDSTTAKTLTYGESITVKAQAYQSNSASVKTDKATRTITAPAFPSVGTWGLSYVSAPYTYNATVKVGGTTYTSGELNAPEAYANGWTGCYNNVGLDSTTATTLGYGQSVTVYAQAYQSNSASVKTNVASRTIIAPSGEINVERGSWTTSRSSQGDTTSYASVTYSPSGGTGTSKTLYVGHGIFYVASSPTGGYIRIVAKDDSTSAATTIVSDRPFELWDEEWSGNTKAVHISIGNTRTNRGTLTVDASSLVSSATTNGKVSAGVSGTWGEGSGGNVLTVARELTESTKTLTYTVTAGVSATYNSSTHKYALTGTASVNNTQRASAVSSTGTQAYDAGVSSVTLGSTTWSNGNPYTNGSSNKAIIGISNSDAKREIPVTLSQGIWNSNKKNVDITTTNGAVVARTSVDASSIYTAGNDAGKLTGWSSAYGKVSLPTANTSTASMVVKTPASTEASNPNQTSTTYTVSVDREYGYIKVGTTTVARVSHSYKYTQAQVDEFYEVGWNDGWNAYRNDTPDWFSAWPETGTTYSVWRPKRSTQYDYYNSSYGRGKGNGSSSTCEEWFRYTEGGSSATVSWGTVSQYSEKQTGVDKDYPVSKGYSHYVIRFTVDGRTYKVQVNAE